jgi:hypothetical protein
LWIARLVAITLLVFACAPTALEAETPPEQMEAIKALSPVRSNIQLNRDGTVRFARFSKSVLSDEHLKHLRVFAQLDYLAIVTPTVSDEGISNIAALTNLDTLFLSDSGLTIQGMQYLAGLTKIERLYLDRTMIDDTELQQLAKLENLKVLSLNGTDISDAGLDILASFPSLETLSLVDTKITDAGLGSISSSCPLLKSLALDGCQIEGKSLESLVELPLEFLSLNRTKVDNEALLKLSSSKSLKQLLVYETSIDADSEQLAELTRVTLHVTPKPDSSRNAWQRFLAGEPLRQTVDSRPLVNDAGNNDTGNNDTGNNDAGNNDTGNEGKGVAVLNPAEHGDEEWLATPDFQRHVVPLLGRLGCNGRSCHGSFQGKGGVRLSMFGYDFAADWEALAGGDSPRVDVASPIDSLILTHPTTEDHGGGIRFTTDSWQASLLQRWIESGGKGTGTPARLVTVEITPGELVFAKPGEQAQLTAIAVWSDGLRENVTKLTRFQSNDDAVAEVTEDGLVTLLAPGDTWIIAYYDSAVVATQAFLPFGRSAEPSNSETDLPSPVDQFIGKNLAKLGIEASEISSDIEFLRRVSLDISGTLPTPEEITSFVEDPDKGKRAKKIDELLESPAYAQWWAMWLSDLTGSNSQYLGSTDMNSPASAQWNAWLHRRVEDNVGWDKIAAGLLLATSRPPGQQYAEYAAEQSLHLRRKAPTDFTALDQPMHYYWFRSNNQLPTDRALSFGYVFMGVRLQCAQCHKHPFDQWSKEEFDQFTQFFTRIKTGIAPDAQAIQLQLKNKLGVPKKLDTAALRRQMYLRVSAEGLPIPWNEVWVQPPPSGKPQPARVLGGEVVDLAQFEDPREPLVAWLTSPDNPYFAKAFVNRVWARYMGIGIVDPPDDFNQANPPSNRELLDWLSTEFLSRDYDMKWLHRTVANSQAYQRSWRPTDTNRKDRRNFSHAMIRRLPAEVTIDAILQATSAAKRNLTWRDDLSGRKIGQHPKSIQTRGIDFSLLVFGKPLRTTNCDCERQMQPTLLQSLYVRNDREMIEWLNRPDGWIKEMTISNKDKNKDEPQLEDHVHQAYLRTLSRLPSQDEQTIALDYLENAATVAEGLEELLWVLLNTREFQTNH